MSNKVIIGNQKMNMTASEQRKFINKLVPLVEYVDFDIALCVPFTNLAICKRALKETSIIYGAQNVSGNEKGCFTGEVSSSMLADLGCKLTLVGHSERRKLFNEKNSDINAKIKQNLRYNITSVLCVGESKRERIADMTKEVLSKQIDECLVGLYENELENIIVAYEPVWAIGTGQVATKNQIEEAIKIIREEIARIYSESVAKHILVIYGGSIKPETVKTLKTVKGLNGFLVGGTSLDAEAFSQLIHNFKESKK